MMPEEQNILLEEDSYAEDSYVEANWSSCYFTMALHGAMIHTPNTS